MDNFDIIKAAYLYYIKDFTQTEIAKIFGVSKMTISRMLQKAREEDIVKIKIDFPYEFNEKLQEEFIKQFSLKDAFIAKNIANEDIKSLLGRVGAYSLNFYLRNHDILGVGGSETLAYFAKNIKTANHKIDCVVQLMGALEGTVTPYNSLSLTQTFTDRFKVQGYFFSAPARIEQPEIRNLLLNNSQIKRTMDLWGKCTLAIVGIGAVKNNLPRYFLSIDEFNNLKSIGAVGDILGKFFDINGQLVSSKLQSQILSIALEDLRKINRVIAVAGGEIKVEAILGALHTGVIDILITDEDTALKILKLKKGFA